jgi:hypothetical protein
VIPLQEARQDENDLYEKISFLGRNLDVQIEIDDWLLVQTMNNFKISWQTLHSKQQLGVESVFSKG